MPLRFATITYGPLRRVQTQTEAASHAHDGGIALVMAGRRAKTAVFACPSGCGEILRINLIPAVGQAWRVRIERGNRLTLTPSVDLRAGCRAHFVIARGQAHVVLGTLPEDD